jgi:hypothetical protein
MNGKTPGPGNLPDEDPRLGEPIAALNLLEQNAPAGFFGKIRKKILRRVATSQLASFSWQLPRVISIELLTMFVQILGGFRSRKKGERS